MKLELNHFSGSTINSFIERRPSFYKSKILKKGIIVNPNMARGSAVEGYVNAYFRGEQISPIEIYDHELEDYPKDERYKRIRDSVAPLAELALHHYKNEFLNPPTMQMKIETRLDGVDRPVIGYLDYLEYGRQVRDCKVVERNSSKLPQSYVVTGSLYKKAMNCDVYYDLFVNNKKPVHTELKLSDEEYEFGISYATAAAKAIEELMECQDTDRFFELMCFPDLSTYYDEVERKEMADMWGIKA